MQRIFYFLIAVILLSSCTVTTEQSSVQDVDKLAKPEFSIVILDELLNEPPENPRFVIAQSPAVDPPERPITESIKRQLLHLGYVEAASRDDANVVVWYSYESEQTNMRHVGHAKDVWGDQAAPLVVSDLGIIAPILFKVQIISLIESRFPHQVIPIWQGEWSSSLPGITMVEFTNETLAKVFDQYQSGETQSQLAKFRQAREKRVQHAINTYMKMVMYRIQKNWKKPKSRVKGKTCKVKIVQSAVGEIKSHKLITCDKDRRFRRSIEKAIKASSPLPLPREHVFDRRELILVFHG